MLSSSAGKFSESKKFAVEEDPDWDRGEIFLIKESRVVVFKWMFLQKRML